MNLKGLLKTAHHLIEAKEHGDITQNDMAKRLGISERSYAEYLSGRRQPLAVSAVLRMLGQLSNKDILKLIRASGKGGNKLTTTGKKQ